MTAWVRNCGAYMSRLLKIRDKKGNIIPLRLNRPQQKLYQAVKELREAGMPVRIVVLKARQMGFSTVIEAIIFWATATAGNVASFIMAHREDSTNNLFDMFKRFYDNLPQRLRPLRKAVNGRELKFAAPTRSPAGAKGLDSSILVATAGAGEGVGRSFTFRNVHLSEFAFWPGVKRNTLTAIMQTVPDELDTMVFIESTANGFDEFKDLWDASYDAWERGERDGWRPVFAGWWEMEEYRRRPPADFQRTEEEKQLAQTYGLDDGQLAWRRWCIKVNCQGDEQLFRQEYPACPEEAFLASGSCIFDQQAIVLHLQRCKGVWAARGRFAYRYDGREVRDIQWEDDPAGEIKIFQPPERGRPYVLGGDTAGDSGGEWSDFFTGQVLDNVTGRQAARLWGKFDEDEYARQIYCLGMWYQAALVGVEVNFSTHPNKELARLGYPNLYVREVTDTYTGKLKQTYGFRTDRVTRPEIIARLKEVARDALDTIRDEDTLNEMLSFARVDGRAEALPGKHDDLVMGLAIAHHIRPQQRSTVQKPRNERVKWTEDQWEDYRNASRQEREELIRLCGEPGR